jgi:DNA-directed RNA polymerase specialized sigma24 family protein
MNANSPTEREERDQAAEVLSADRLAQLQATVDYHARRVARVAPESGGDLEDLRQALLLEALSVAPKFEPGRGSWPTFINLHLKGAGWDLAGRRFRQRRLAARSLGGDRLTDPERSSSWEPDLVDVDDGQDDRFDLINQAIDVERAMDTLPDGLRELCRLLQHGSPTAAQRKIGICSAEYYRQRQEIAMRLRAFGVSQP